MPFAMSKSVNMPRKMAPRTLNKPKEVEKSDENLEHLQDVQDFQDNQDDQNEEQSKSAPTNQKSTKKSGLLISTNLDTENNL